MTGRCICYTTDPSYLFPTFVSAMQARALTPADIADVAIFSIGGTTQQEAAFAHASAAEGIRFLPVPSTSLDGANAMLARLFLDRFVPPEYDQLLYIDGDTQITDALTPLLQTHVPAGHFCAARDPMTFSLLASGQNDRKLTSYFASLGLEPTKASNYFNSGVLRINRTGWGEIGCDSWALFQKLRGRTRYPDQDALNLVAMDRCIPISLIWNFPIFLRNAGLEDAISPRIIHYMGSPKPWHGQFLPWGPTEYAIYLAAAQRYPALSPYLLRMAWPRRLKYLLQQKFKQKQETATWGLGRRHREILRYENHMKHGPPPEHSPPVATAYG
jgi:lipopolysaccharide biosynthesis glycosyltransferase